MRKIIFGFAFFLLFINCNKKEKTTIDEKTCSKEKKFDMYQMSEMALLMEQMNVENLQLKNRIIKGEPIGKFPEYFLKIHSSKMTDESDNDTFFKENADLYIKAQKLIYEDTINAKTHFNEGVNACVTCHEGKCGGPIPKIKKLYIN
jgi:hypothetical protein